MFVMVFKVSGRLSIWNEAGMCGFISHFTSGRAEILSTAVGYVSYACITYPKKCLD